MHRAKLTEDQVYERLRRVMDGYSTVQHRLQTNMAFRARKNNGDEPFTNVSELWYPPASVVRRGRFNATGEPMFYVSNRFRAALFEMRPMVGDTFTVLAAHRRPPFRDMVCASIGMRRCVAPEASQGTPGWLLDHPTMQRLFAVPGFSTRWLAIDDYLSGICTAQCPAGCGDSFYKPTNALARVFANIPDADALQYPSVAMHLRGVNLCLPPHKADELFTAGEAWMVRITGYQDTLPGAPPSNIGYYAFDFFARTGPIREPGELDWQPALGTPFPPYITGEPLWF